MTLKFRVINAEMDAKLAFKPIDFQDLFCLSAQFPLILGQFASQNRCFNRQASMILMSSLALSIGTSEMSIYSSPKAAMNSICKNLSIELTGKQLRINAILTGAVQTDMHAQTSKLLPQKSFNDYRAKHLLGVGKPSYTSNIDVFLFSQASIWIIGSLFLVRKKGGGGTSCFKS